MGMTFVGQAQRADSAFFVDVQQYSALYSAATSPQGRVAVLGQQAYTDGRLLGNLTVFNGQGQVDLSFQQQAGLIEAKSAVPALPSLVRFYPDGRLLVASSASGAGSVSAPVLRLLADGARDYSFQAPTVALPTLRAVAVQPDGKVLLAGSGNSSSGVGLLIRLNADGTLDTGFSATLGGRINDYVAALAVQPDGKILVGGFFVSPAPALVRLLPNGQRDPTFQANVSAGGDVQEILVRPSGQIIVASRPALTVQGRAGGLQQLLPSGDLDPSFQAPAAYGFVKIGDGRRVHLLRGGALLALPTTPATLTAVRLLASGVPDPAYAGVAQWPVLVRVATVDTAGALLVGGVFRHRSAGLGSLLKLLPAGQLDPNFRPQLTEPGEVAQVVEQPGRGVVLAGRFDMVNGFTAPNLARLWPGRAEVDTAFGNHVPRTDALNQVVVQPNSGHLLVSGFSTLNEASGGGVARLMPDGQLDPLFRRYSGNYPVYGLAAQPDGRFLVAGPFAFESAQLDAARFLANGDFDPSFAVAQSLRLGTKSRILVQPDGRVLLFDGRVAVRVQATGQFDPSFAPTALRNYANALTEAAVLQPNGSITLCGQMPGATSGMMSSLLRLLPNGRRDSTLTDPLNRAIFRPRSLAYYPDGRLLVGGNVLSYATTPTPRIGLYQLLHDGSIDPAFESASGVGTVLSVLRTNAGRVMAAGNFYYFANALQQQLSFVAFTSAQPLAVSAGGPASVLAVYPNPAHAQLHLVLDAAAHPQTVILLDALGRPMLTQAVVQSAMSLTTSALPPGTYWLRVNYADGHVTTRRVALE